MDWVQAAIPNKHVFLLALCAFLFAAAALMEIFAAIAVLVPMLLPLARSYAWSRCTSASSSWPRWKPASSARRPA